MKILSMSNTFQYTIFVLQISQGYMCLFCNETGRTFYSMEAARGHMVSKGHCKMLHEGIALAEYADYYDYRLLYFYNNTTYTHTNTPPHTLTTNIPPIHDAEYVRAVLRLSSFVAVE